MESMVQVIQRLEKKGYVEQCRAESGGIRFLSDDQFFTTQQIKVDAVERIEGTSSPDEESTIYALSAPDAKKRGTLCVAFGPELSREETDTIQKLKIKH